MTPREWNVLKFVSVYIERNKVSPTYREIGAATDLGKGQIHDVLKSLAEQGKVRVRPRKARSIEILSEEMLVPKIEALLRDYDSLQITTQAFISELREQVRAHGGVV